MTAVRTRFAPSPTGFLHVGGARTALFAWAYARRHGGSFVLRIEDTDLERSTEASVQVILEGMRWLGLDWDEGPFFQMQRLARYREVAERLIAQGHAYPCWATREQLDALRERQREAGEKPRYDGRWRPERAKAAGLVPPRDRPPVIRFRNPDEGVVSFHDLIKGPITIANAELDDLVLLRADGVPTYNFGVVVDDLDMAITHVIRGDDHVNNTPRQVNIFRALGGGVEAALPKFAHVPMILGPDGERLSKRHGAVSVTQYRDSGFLPEALLNYLARLGWSHGNEEVFHRDQFVAWFDLEHVARSPAQFDPGKLTWLNQHYVKTAPNERLAELARKELGRLGVETAAGPDLRQVVALLKDRAATIPQLAESAALFYREPQPAPQLLAEHVLPTIRPALHILQAKLAALANWDRALIAAAVKETLATAGIKMPALAMPLRVILTGQTQTPSIDVVLELLGRERALGRLAQRLDAD